MAFSCFLFGLNESLALFPSRTNVLSMQRAGRQEELSLLASPGKKQYFPLLLTPERTSPRGFKAACCDQVIKKPQPTNQKILKKQTPKQAF